MGTKWNPHTPLAGMQNGTIALDNSLAVPQKVTVIIWLSNSSPRYIPKRNKNMSPCKNTCLNFHNSIIHNNNNKKPNPNVHQQIKG